MSIISGYFGTWGTTVNKSIGAVASREIFVRAHHARSRQSGFAHGVRLFFGDPTGLTAVYAKVYRRRQGGTTFDLVGTSSNLVSQISAGTVQDLFFAAPFGVGEDDYVAIRMEGSANGVNQLVLGTNANAEILEVTNSTPAATNFDWLAQTATSGLLKVQLIGERTKIVHIGYSNIAGSNDHKSFCEVISLATDASLTATKGTIPYRMGRLVDLPYQNMGIGSQSAAEILARLVKDAIDPGADLVVLHVGGNDILTGVSQSTFLAGATSILNLLRSYNIEVLVLAILPGTAYTDAQSATRDSFNSALQALVATYQGVKWCDPSGIVGQERASGSRGNTWDIKTAFNGGDGLHFTAAAHRLIAHAMAKSLNSFTVEAK